MYETKSKILSGDYIGNSLSSMNFNFSVLETWTNNILLSSEKYYEPLMNFYKSYGEFWKSSINFSKKINAIERLSNFSTNVETNSAKYIKPIVIIYPNVILFNNANIVKYKNDAIDWFKEKYPVKDEKNLKTNFVENSVAFVYLMFYQEELKLNTEFKTVDTTLCQTNDVGITAKCQHNLSGDVSCGKKKIVEDNVCQRYPTVSCDLTFPVRCGYDANWAKSITRGGSLTVDRYFNDRSEIDRIIVYMLKVENCEWVYKSTIPYNDVL
jgi:hypothetical protein